MWSVGWVVGGGCLCVAVGLVMLVECVVQGTEVVEGAVADLEVDAEEDSH